MTQAMHDYFLMGGYAAFIWPAYGIAAVILIGFAVDSWRRLRKAVAELRRLEATVAQAKSGDAGKRPDQRTTNA